MEIFSTLHLKKNNVRFLMKQEQIKIALIKLFNGNKIKWHDVNNEKNAKLVNITNVILSKDYNNAKVYVNLYSYISGNEIDIEHIVKYLNKEVINIKHHLSKVLKLRKVPNLSFKVDKINDKVKKLESVLNSLTYSSDKND